MISASTSSSQELLPDRASHVWRYSAHLVEVAVTATCCWGCCRCCRRSRSRHVVLKVRVVARLLGRNSSCRVIDKHHLEQVQALVIEAGRERLLVVSLPLGERCLKIGIGCDARPQVFCGSSESTGDKQILVSQTKSQSASCQMGRNRGLLTGIF